MKPMIIPLRLDWMKWCERCGQRHWTKSKLVKGIPHNLCDQCYYSIFGAEIQLGDQNESTDRER